MIRLVVALFLGLCSVAQAQGPILPGPGLPVASGVTCSSSEGNAFLARLTGSPDNAHKTAYCTLIDGLVTDGVWSKLDALYMFAADSSANGLLNLVSATGNASLVGSVTFTVDTGFAGNGTTSQYINTNLNPQSTSQFTQNSAHLSVWGKLTAPSNFGGFSGFADSGFTVTTQIRTGDASSTATGFINDAANFAAGATVNVADQHQMINRSSSTARQFYRNGSSVATGSQASVALPSGVTFFIGCRNVGGSPGSCTTQQFMMASVGSSLNGGSDAANFYARVHTYLQTIAGIP